MSEDGWVDFPFHDQLNITAKICTVQTMQIADCVEQIIVNRNSMALEINSEFTQVWMSIYLHACFHLTSLINISSGRPYQHKMRSGKNCHA